MQDPNDTQGGKKDVKRTSGATRRIVVRDVEPEKPPKAIGRRLSTPAPSAHDQVGAHHSHYAGATTRR